MEIAKPGHMPGVHHSSEGGGEGLLTIRFNSWFWIICPSGFKFFLASSLLSPGGAEVLPSWFLSFSLSHLHLFSLAFSFSIVLICLFLFSSFHHSFFLSLSILFPFSIFNSFSLSSTFSPFGFVLYLSALIFTSIQSFSVSGPLKRKFSCHTNRDYCCVSQCNHNAWT